MPGSKIEALIKLLDDPDENIFLKVKKSILELGKNSVPEIEKALKNSSNQNFNKRAKKIIKQILFTETKNEFINWTKDNKNDIMAGFIILAKYQNPKLKTSSIFDKTNVILNDIRVELNVYLTALQQIRIINNIIFGVHQFGGNFEDVKNPDNFFIDKVINSKKGNDITIAVLYQYIAKQAGLNLYGINFPRNFLLAFADERNSEKITLKNILFYINPFNKGAIITAQDINAFLDRNKIEKIEKFYLPCSNKDIMHRALISLLNIYKEKNKTGKLKNYGKLLKILEKNLYSK